MSKNEFKLGEEEAISQRISDLHVELGAVPSRVLATEALARDFWDDARLDGALVEWAQRMVRKALHTEDPATGVDRALPLGKGADAEWKQTSYLEVDEANSVMHDRVAEWTADYLKMKKLHDYFVDKFGKDAIDPIPSFR